jgi:hypothetical protein
VQSVLPWLYAQNKPFLLAGPRLEFNDGVIWNPIEMSWNEFESSAIRGEKYAS